MLNPRVGGRYAKSIKDLAIETNQLQEVYNDMLFLQRIIKSNRDLASLLKSPIIRADKKIGILNAITEGKTSVLTSTFIRLLVQKGREENLPEIITAFIEQYKEYKNIYPIKLTTAVPVSDELKQAIIRKVQNETAMKNIELKTEVEENLLGGFRLELGHVLVDASIIYDLNKIKAQFLNNDFIYKIR